jgi:hypothetical protein
MPRPEFALKDKMRLAGLDKTDLAAAIGRPVGLLVLWLDGVIPLPDEERDLIQYALSQCNGRTVSKERQAQ